MHQEFQTPQEVKIPDADRILTFEVSGDPYGFPIFLHHGMPGSSSGPRPRNAVLYRSGIKLVSHNRPGYGRSTRSPGRTVADVAHDVAVIADHLGIDKFAVMGRSGGGPHALACAALLPDRVLRAAVLASFAPAEAAGLDWDDEMVGSNIEAYRDARFDKRRLIETLRIRADRVLTEPAYLIDLLRADLTRADARIVEDVQVNNLLLRTYQDAVTDGPFGWIDDLFALRHHWGFRPESIRVPVRLWHGADDQFAPPSHTKWLAAKIPGATLELQQGAAHFGALTVMLRLLELLANDTAAPAAAPPAAADARAAEKINGADEGPARTAGTAQTATPAVNGTPALNGRPVVNGAPAVNGSAAVPVFARLADRTNGADNGLAFAARTAQTATPAAAMNGTAAAATNGSAMAAATNGAPANGVPAGGDVPAPAGSAAPATGGAATPAGEAAEPVRPVALPASPDHSYRRPTPATVFAHRSTAAARR